MGRDKKNENSPLTDAQVAQMRGIPAGRRPPTSWDRLITAWRSATKAERQLLLDLAEGESHEP